MYKILFFKLLFIFSDKSEREGKTLGMSAKMAVVFTITEISYLVLDISHELMQGLF